jgi:hypothetical protein
MAFTLRRYQEEWGKFVAAYKAAPPANHAGGDFPNRLKSACQASPYMAAHLLILVLILAGLAVLI